LNPKGHSMSNEAPVVDKASPGRLFVPSLVLPAFASFISNGILILLLSNIALTFFGSSSPSSVGVAGQISTVNSAAETVFAVLMVFLVVRFRHKPLFLVSILLIAVSAVGNFFAPTFMWMQVFFAIEGIGSVIGAITGFTLIGDRLPSDKKPKAVSYALSAVFLGGIVGAPIIGLVTGFGGWRYSFLLYALPVSVVCLILAYVGIPSTSNKQQVTTKKENYVRSFKQVLLNKSAFSCLISQLLSVAQIVGLYTIAFFQGQFSIPISSSIFIVMGSTSFMIVGSLVGGRIVNRFGRKRTTIIGSVLDGIFLVGVFLVPNLWVALAFNFAHVLFMAMAISAFNCLALDQVPQSRATMMSLTNVFGKIGNTIAAAVGGLVLFLFSSFQLLGLVFGAMTLATAAILSFLTKDPPRT
jgi:predicted MFS family arabinose efflux permease